MKWLLMLGFVIPTVLACQQDTVTIKPGHSVLILAPDTAADSTACAATRVVHVSTAAQLTSAKDNAVPGDSIVLASATYSGRWTVTKSGDECHRIYLTGPRTAVLLGPDLTGGTGLYLNGADYWTLDGFTVKKNIAGIALKNGALHNDVLNVRVTGTGQAALVIKQNSSHNRLRFNEADHTGISNPQFGECVYIGTTEGQWVNGEPDRSDSNEVYGNNLHDCTADEVQSMAGTTGTLIRKNTMDGAGMVAVAGSPPHWVLAMGNEMLVDSNTATNALTQGIKVRRSTTANEWGSNVVFGANTMTMGTKAASYPAIYLETPPAQGMVVGCDNVRTDPGTLSNVACQ